MKPLNVFGTGLASIRRFGAGIGPLAGLLKRRRALIGVAMLAGLFVVMSLVSSAATGRAGDQSPPPAVEVKAESTGGVSGSGTATAESPADVPNPGMGIMAFKVIGSVLLLIVVLYAGVYAMRLLSGRAAKGGFNSGAIKVLHKTHIAPKKAVYVLRVGEKAMVVGVTDSQISHLSDLSPEDMASLETPDKAGAQGRSFKQHILGFALGGKERP